MGTGFRACSNGLGNHDPPPRTAPRRTARGRRHELWIGQHPAASDDSDEQGVDTGRDVEGHDLFSGPTHSELPTGQRVYAIDVTLIQDPERGLADHPHTGEGAISGNALGVKMAREAHAGSTLMARGRTHRPNPSLAHYVAGVEPLALIEPGSPPLPSGKPIPEGPVMGLARREPAAGWRPRISPPRRRHSMPSTPPFIDTPKTRSGHVLALRGPNMFPTAQSDVGDRAS